MILHCIFLTIIQVSGAFVTLRVFRVFRIFKFSRHSQVYYLMISHHSIPIKPITPVQRISIQICINFTLQGLRILGYTLQVTESTKYIKGAPKMSHTGLKLKSIPKVWFLLYHIHVFRNFQPDPSKYFEHIGFHLQQGLRARREDSALKILPDS